LAGIRKLGVLQLLAICQYFGLALFHIPFYLFSCVMAFYCVSKERNILEVSKELKCKIKCCFKFQKRKERISKAR
jgi:hypothetical protein